MTATPGLRQRKKAQQRERIADVAAELFAASGYDAVAVLDVARAADVSDQTVYNYFPAKHDLVLDRADEFRELYALAVRNRPRGTNPAAALRPLIDADIERYRQGDPVQAKGEFPALCLASGGLRRFALELREQQTQRLAEALLETDPIIPEILARAHAASLISVVQSVTDRIGAEVLGGTPNEQSAADMGRMSNVALDALGSTFENLIPPTPTGSHS